MCVTINIAPGSQYTDANNPSRVKKNALAGLKLQPDTQIHVVIEDGITEIEEEAFSNCINLIAVDIPIDVNSIGNRAFSNCNGLIEVRINKTNGDRIISLNLLDKQELIELNEADFPQRDITVINNYINNPNVITKIMQWTQKPYRWHQNDEVHTVRTFNDFSLGLNFAIRDGDDASLVFYIAKILKWGGVLQHPELIRDYYWRLKKCVEEETSNVEILLSRGQNSKGKDRVPTWSKVLAAFVPQYGAEYEGTYFIYDTRVAIALSWIAHECGLPFVWNIPKPRKATAEPKRKITIRRKKAFLCFRQECEDTQEMRGVSECYRLYLELLNRLADKIIRENRKPFAIDNPFENAPTKEQIIAAYNQAFGPDGSKKSIMAHLEKALFMQNEDILDEYAQRNGITG